MDKDIKDKFSYGTLRLVLALGLGVLTYNYPAYRMGYFIMLFLGMNFINGYENGE